MADSSEPANPERKISILPDSCSPTGRSESHADYVGEELMKNIVRFYEKCSVCNNLCDTVFAKYNECGATRLLMNAD